MKSLTDFICESITVEQIEKSKIFQGLSQAKNTRALIFKIAKGTGIGYKLNKKVRGKEISSEEYEKNVKYVLQRLADDDYQLIGELKSKKFIPFNADKLEKLWYNPSEIKGAKVVYEKDSDILGFEFSLKGIFSGKIFIKTNDVGSEVLANTDEKDINDLDIYFAEEED